jgi:mRNA interferase RelE/StbE
MPSKIEKLDQLLSQVGVRVVFTQEAVRDYKSFPLSSRQLILEMIVKQAQKGAKLKPDGTGVRLRAPLHFFGKIKRTSTNLRIIYRPTSLKDGSLQMEIIAIGPRDKAEVYKLAEERLSRFFAKPSP